MSSNTRVQAEIRALRQHHNRALAALDVVGVTGLVTDDFVMILGGGQVLRGANAYREFVIRSFALPDPMRFVRTPDKIDLGMADGVAVAAETGRWSGTSATIVQPPIRIGGRYLVHWVRQEAGWRIASETYVTLADD